MDSNWSVLTSSDLELGKDDCLCLMINIRQISLSDLDLMRSHLDEKDALMANTMTNEQNRRQFIASRLLQKVYLKSIFASKPDIGLGVNGKPFLEDGSGEFNVTHSGDYLVTAFAHHPIGVDLEKVKDFPERNYIKNNFFHPGETAELNQLQDEDFDVAFFTCWTRKEALLKAIGCGLELETTSFRVSSKSDQPHLIEGPDAKNSDWKFINLLQIHPEYIGSICHNRPALAVRFRYVPPDLSWVST